MTFSRNWVACVFSALTPVLAVVPLSAVAADDFPNRPISLVVPTGPGGVTDIMARSLGQRLSQELSQPIVIENRAGASGVVGSSYVARAKPDGYTLLLSFPSHVINPSVVPKLPYDTVKDFAPVAKIGSVSLLMLVGADSPASNVQAFVESARKQPGDLNYGTVGSGSFGELAMLMLQQQADMQLQNVSYKGDPQILAALMQGEIQAAFLSPSSSLAMLNAGRLRTLGTSSGQRLGVLPDVPTLAEAGIKDFSVEGWTALFAPAGTPQPVIDKLNQAVNVALKDPALQESFKNLGIATLGGTPEQLQSSVESELATVATMFQSANLKKVSSSY